MAGQLSAALAVVILAGPAWALEAVAPPSSSQPAAVYQIEKAELALAQAIAQAGVGPGLRRYADAGAVMFLPDPIPAGPYLQAARSPGVLVRRPQYIGVAPSGDLGFSLGPSLSRVAGKSSGGYYLTLWKRGPDGVWLFILDHSVDMPAALFDGPVQPLVLMPTDPRVRPDQSEGLREADAALDADLSNGPSRAFAPRLDDVALAVRANRPVASGRRRMLKLIADSPPILEAQLLNGGVSSDGVLGYTYGRARWSAGAGVQSGYYVRVWRNTGQGWRLLVDHMSER